MALTQSQTTRNRADDEEADLYTDFRGETSVSVRILCPQPSSAYLFDDHGTSLAWHQEWLEKVGPINEKQRIHSFKKTKSNLAFGALLSPRIHSSRPDPRDLVVKVVVLKLFVNCTILKTHW